jgi:predicted phosphodiesterase
MRIALLSDVHGNLPALEAVLADVEAQSDIEAAYHLGDLVGYGPWPNEVVGLIASRGIAGVGGNYDSTVALDAEHCGCRYENPDQEADAHLGFTWTKEHCSSVTKRFLAALPFRLDLRPSGGHAGGAAVILVHGNPVLNTVYWTEDRTDDFCRKMMALASAKPGDVLAFGHTHRPWSREVDGALLVNTGAVSRPKDGDWRAGWVRLDFPAAGGRPAIEFRRVEYDVDRAVAATKASTLPVRFAEQLKTGR